MYNGDDILENFIKQLDKNNQLIERMTEVISTMDNNNKEILEKQSEESRKTLVSITIGLCTSLIVIVGLFIGCYFGSACGFDKNIKITNDSSSSSSSTTESEIENEIESKE